MFDTDDKLPDDIILEKVTILMACVIKDGNRFYQGLFLEHELQGKTNIFKLRKSKYLNHTRIHFQIF